MSIAMEVEEEEGEAFDYPPIEETLDDAASTLDRWLEVHSDPEEYLSQFECGWNLCFIEQVGRLLAEEPDRRGYQSFANSINEDPNFERDLFELMKKYMKKWTDSLYGEDRLPEVRKVLDELRGDDEQDALRALLKACHLEHHSGGILKDYGHGDVSELVDDLCQHGLEHVFGREQVQEYLGE